MSYKPELIEKSAGAQGCLIGLFECSINNLP